MFPHIKLYGKTLIQGKTKTHEEAISELARYHNEYIKIPIQSWESQVIPRKDRKVYKYDFECRYYELETLKEMIEDTIRAKNG